MSPLGRNARLHGFTSPLRNGTTRIVPSSDGDSLGVSGNGNGGRRASRSPACGGPAGLAGACCANATVDKTTVAAKMGNPADEQNEIRRVMNPPEELG
jgi:hypothetical protein